MQVSGSGEPMAPATTLPKPKGLKGTAKKLYQVVGTELASKGLLDVVNLDLLLAYCREMALYQDMMKDLEAEALPDCLSAKSTRLRTKWQQQSHTYLFFYKVPSFFRIFAPAH